MFLLGLLCGALVGVLTGAAAVLRACTKKKKPAELAPAEEKKLLGGGEVEAGPYRTIGEVVEEVSTAITATSGTNIVPPSDPFEGLDVYSLQKRSQDAVKIFTAELYAQTVKKCRGVLVIAADNGSHKTSVTLYGSLSLRANATEAKSSLWLANKAAAEKIANELNNAGVTTRVDAVSNYYDTLEDAVETDYVILHMSWEEEKKHNVSSSGS